jgi:hypothetical protein
MNYYLDLSEERFLDLADLPGEKWADVEGFEDTYQISNWCRLKSKERIRKGRFNSKTGCYTQVPVKASIRRIKYDKDGYINYALCPGEHKKLVHKRGHLLVAKAFVPNPDNLPIVNHKNRNTSDCRAENLEWCDYTYNRNYSYESIPTLKRVEYDNFEYNSIRECSRALKLDFRAIRWHIKQDTEYKGHKFILL